MAAFTREGTMADIIRFRARLSTNDWDPNVGAFRCSALAIPNATVIEVHGDGKARPLADFSIDAYARELRYLGSEQPRELVLTIQLSSSLTTWRKAGLSGSIVRASSCAHHRRGAVRGSGGTSPHSRGASSERAQSG
jgi:hypothetical protein